MLNSGEVFAGYTVERLLGQGGMGSVYLARHPRFSRQTALKLLNPELFTDAEVRARFEREADLVAQLDHPSIVTVYDRGSEHGQLWIAMQYIDGVDAAAVNPLTLPPERAVQIIEGVADALDYAHGMGVLHRDVKPANIMLARASGGQRERVFLTDFGIARLREESTHLTQTGMFTATLAYASPEQMTGGHLDPRTDQYALACALYWLLAGVGPFDADNPADIIKGHLQLALPPLAVRRPGLNPALDVVLAAGMAKRPDHRYNSCAEFAAAARHALTTTSGPRLPTPPPMPPQQYAAPQPYAVPVQQVPAPGYQVPPNPPYPPAPPPGYAPPYGPEGSRGGPGYQGAPGYSAAMPPAMPPGPASVAPPSPAAGYGGDRTVAYSPDSSTGYPPESSTGYAPDPSVGYAPERSPGHAPEQSAGIPPDQTVGYPPEQPSGYTAESGYPPEQSTDYAPEQSFGYPPEQPGAYPSDQRAAPASAAAPDGGVDPGNRFGVDLVKRSDDAGGATVSMPGAHTYDAAGYTATSRLPAWEEPGNASATTEAYATRDADGAVRAAVSQDSPPMREDGTRSGAAGDSSGSGLPDDRTAGTTESTDGAAESSGAEAASTPASDVTPDDRRNSTHAAGYARAASTRDSTAESGDAVPDGDPADEHAPVDAPATASGTEGENPEPPPGAPGQAYPSAPPGSGFGPPPGYPPTYGDGSGGRRPRGWIPLLAVLATALAAVVVIAVGLITVVVLNKDDSVNTAATPADSPTPRTASSAAQDRLSDSKRAFPRLLPQAPGARGDGYQDTACTAYRPSDGYRPQEEALRLSKWTIAWECVRLGNDPERMSYTILGYDSPDAAAEAVEELPNTIDYPSVKSGVAHTRHTWVVPDPPGPLQPYFYTAKMVVTFDNDPNHAEYLLYVSHQGTSRHPQSAQPSADADLADWWSRVPL